MRRVDTWTHANNPSFCLICLRHNAQKPFFLIFRNEIKRSLIIRIWPSKHLNGLFEQYHTIIWKYISWFEYYSTKSILKGLTTTFLQITINLNVDCNVIAPLWLSFHKLILILHWKLIVKWSFSIIMEMCFENMNFLLPIHLNVFLFTKV